MTKGLIRVDTFKLDGNFHGRGRTTRRHGLLFVWTLYDGRRKGFHLWAYRRTGACRGLGVYWGRR